VERKRADAQKARQEAAARRTQGKLLVVEEKHRLAEEARRVSEECRKKRLSLGSDPGKPQSPGLRCENLRGGRRSEVLDARRRAVLERGLTRRRAKSADAAQEREAEQRKAEQEKERLEKEEAPMSAALAPKERPGPRSMALALSSTESSDEEAMPPLHVPQVQKRIPSSRESSSSEDSMPPLNQGHENQDRQSLEHAPDDEPSESSSDDSMPPLHAQLEEAEDNSTDEETMPPLHGILRTGPAGGYAEKSEVMPPPAESAERLHVPQVQKQIPSSRESSSSEDSMPPLNQGHENQDRQSLEHAPDDEPSESSSDDSMPPLHAQLEEAEDNSTDEETMPPLHGVLRTGPAGGYAKKSEVMPPPLHAQLEDQECEDNSTDEETMPPLHGVLRTGPAGGYAEKSEVMPPPAESAERLHVLQVQKRIPSSRESSSSEDSMPPLNQGHENQDRQSLEHAPDDEPSDASSDGFMPPLHTQLEDQECEDNSTDEETIPPLHGVLRTGPDAAEAETSEAPPPVERSESSDGSMPPLDTRDDTNTDEEEAEAPSYDLHVSAARGCSGAPAAREAVAVGSPAAEKQEVEESAAKEETEEATGDAEAEDAGSESGDSLPPLEFLSRAEQVEEDLSIGDFVHLANLKTPGLNGQQGYVVGFSSKEPSESERSERSERRVEIKMVSGGKTLSVKLSNVLRCAPIAKKQKPKQSLQKGDEVIVKGLTRSVEFNGQRALVIDAQDVRVTVELRSGQHLSLRRDKLKPVDSGSEAEDSDADPRRGDKTIPALKSLRQKKEETEEPLCKFRVGQKVYLHLKNKPEFHGQAVFVLPSDPLRVDPGMVTVQLATGKRIITKATHLRPEPPAIARKAERRRLRLEQQKRRAEESRQRIQEAGGAWHAVLGLTATATLQEVKQAFRDLALLHHPDKGFQSCDDTFRAVRLAYQQAITNFQEKAKAAGS
ncbi:unnamed protein product, partial [Symbiodinium necroappetens]